MTTDLVTYALDGAVATITMDDGKANVMSMEMQSALNAALDRAEEDRAVVLLTGRERVFSGGYDMAMFERGPDEIARTIGTGGRLVARLLGFPRPVVIACGGHAVAQGGFLLLAADARIGARGSFKVGLNEVAIGLTIPHYGIEVARLRLTAPAFNHATTTGAFYTPDEAREAGFFDRVVEHEDVLDTARQTAVLLAAVDVAAHSGTKQRVRGATIALMRERIDEEFGAAEG